jgi:hypothetical protein
MKFLSVDNTLVIGISAVFFSSCGYEIVTQEISVVSDQTEEYFTHISFSEFKEISTLSENINNGECIRIQPITEMGFHEVNECSIAPVIKPLFGNEHNRKKEIESYFAKIEKIFFEIDSGKSEKDGSVIFKVLADELNRLSQSTADTKILIAVTEGMENSALANFYDPSIFNQLQNNPNLMREKFLKKYPLPDLSGIEIYFIYKPISREDSEKFEIVSGFYKSLFESLGAYVTVRGSL